MVRELHLRYVLTSNLPFKRKYSIMSKTLSIYPKRFSIHTTLFFVSLLFIVNPAEILSNTTNDPVAQDSLKKYDRFEIELSGPKELVNHVFLQKQLDHVMATNSPNKKNIHVFAEEKLSTFGKRNAKIRFTLVAETGDKDVMQTIKSVAPLLTAEKIRISKVEDLKITNRTFHRRFSGVGKNYSELNGNVSVESSLKSLTEANKINDKVRDQILKSGEDDVPLERTIYTTNGVSLIGMKTIEVDPISNRRLDVSDTGDSAKFKRAFGPSNKSKSRRGKTQNPKKDAKGNALRQRLSDMTESEKRELATRLAKSFSNRKDGKTKKRRRVLRAKSK